MLDRTQVADRQLSEAHRYPSAAVGSTGPSWGRRALLRGWLTEANWVRQDAACVSVPRVARTVFHVEHGRMYLAACALSNVIQQAGRTFTGPWRRDGRSCRCPLV